MGVLDRIAGMLGYTPAAPARRRRRVVGRIGSREFEAGRWTQLRSSFATSGQNINAELYANLRPMRARSRYLAENNEYLKAFLRLVKTNMIGATGITYTSQAMDANRNPDQRTKEIIEEAVADWSKAPNYDVTGRLDRAGSERLLAESCATDGEFLLRIFRGYDNPWRYAVQHIEIDRLDFELNRERRGGRNAIVMGIEIDRFQRPVAYHLLTSDPSAPNFGISPFEADPGGTRHVRVPADEIIHGFVSWRAEQLRGIPWAHASILGCFDIGGYKEAAIIASRVGAAKMGFFATATGEGAPNTAVDEGGNLILDAAEPGEFHQVGDETELLKWDPAYPHEQFGPGMKVMLRGLAAGLGCAYHSLAQDLESVSFSSSRTGTNEDRDNWQVMQSWFISQVTSRVIPDFLRYQALRGALDVDVANFDGVIKSVYQPRRWPNVDPLKDEQGNAIAWSMRTKSLSQIIRERGMQPDAVFAEIAEDQRKLEDAGIPPVISTAFTPVAAAEPVNDEDFTDAE